MNEQNRIFSMNLKQLLSACSQGGWKSDSILKSVYRNTLDDERRRNDAKINAFLRQTSHDFTQNAQQTAQILRLLTGSSPVAPIRYEDPEKP